MVFNLIYWTDERYIPFFFLGGGGGGRGLSFGDNLKNLFVPMDPNPAISAHAVFPQSGHIRPEKRPFFQKKIHIFPN